MQNLKNKNIAIVHDFLENYGGAEKTLEAICEIFPKAPIYTILCDKEKLAKWDNSAIKGKNISQSFLKKAPDFFRKRKKYLLPLMPSAIEALNLRDYDLIISSSGAFAKGLVLKPKTVHICYMHSPMRYVWDWGREYLEENKLKGKKKLAMRFFLSYLRLWDRASADRPDFLIANSNYTAKRIAKYYRRDSKVIYPPVDIEDIRPTKENEGYFLSVGRISPYKKMDLLVDTFLKLKLPLVIVGDGSERGKLLEKISKNKGTDKIKILGWARRAELVKLYENCRGFIFSAEDDFGISPVEAMGAGKPVIGLRSGGLLETIVEGKTGEFFDEPKMELIADGVRKFMENEKGYDYMEIRNWAEKFSKERFQKELMDYVEKIMSDDLKN